MPCLKQVKKRFRFWTIAALALGGAWVLPCEAAPPSAQELLKMVRANESQQSHQFNGRLRMSNSEGRVVVPFAMTMDRGRITYQFSSPPEALVLQLGEKTSRLERVSGSGRAQNISGARLDGLVRGTDITYEDLALKFLYWNNAKVVREDNLMTRKCWVVEALPSGTASQYDMVRLWIEKTGGLMKAECYSGGKLAKRFEVRSVQKAPGGGYILKTMRIQQMDERGKDRTPTTLELTPA